MWESELKGARPGSLRLTDMSWIQDFDNPRSPGSSDPGCPLPEATLGSDDSTDRDDVLGSPDLFPHDLQVILRKALAAAFLTQSVVITRPVATP